jgi:REP element-mobilizing transposase RayT
VPRPLRDFVPGGYYHLVTRGVNGRAIFIDDADRRRFLALLSIASRRSRWTVHAWCLMTNHYHLLIEATDGGVSEGIRLLNGRYAQFFNERHDRRGHLWGDRFRVTRVESDEHLERAMLYVIENPLRARVVARIDDWPWCGFAAPAPTAGVVGTGL